MRDYDNEILKTNIRKLRDDSGLSQEKFAEIVGVHQSRLSKLLGNDDSNRFSIEQVYRIAKHYNISIDYLVTGEKPKPINSAKAVCEFLVQLFEDYYLEHHDYSRGEIISIPGYYYDSKGHKIPDSEEEKKTIKYNCLFFANCWYPNENREYTEDELDELHMDELYNGNSLPKNIAINKFLNAFIPIHELHSAGKMPDEAYQYTIKSLLDSIDSK